MNALRLLSPVALSLLLAACAGNAPRSPAPPGDAAPLGDEAQAVSSPGDDTPTAAEEDFSALYGTPPQATVAYDPWERYNRAMHRFNMAVDRGVAKPLATGYTKAVPRPVRQGVTNFFGNLRSPLTLVNQLLQGRPGDAWNTLGRFLMNTTLGIGGLFDPASKALIPRGNEDFGQTLATWGWRNSRYFELPFFGPRTLRDTFGLAGDVPLSPMWRIEDDTVRYGLQGLQLVNTRAQLLSLDSLREEAVDEYALTRDAWMQSRNYQIQRDLRRHKDKDGDEDGLPDYLREDNGIVPVDAMPIPLGG